MATELRSLGETLLRGELPAGAELMYNGRNRLYIHTLADGTRVNIKAFRRCGALKGLLYGRLRMNKAQRSLVNGLRLLELGFDTPRPMMACHVSRGGGWVLERAYYVCAQDDDARETRCWEEWPDRDAFVEALGAEMARLMRTGVLMRDFSPGNVMMRRPEEGGYRFVYVDVNRIDFGVRSRRKLMSMFKRINIVEAETERLAGALAREMGWNVRDTQLRALGVLRRFLWLKDDVQKPIKRIFKPKTAKYRK